MAVAISRTADPAGVSASGNIATYSAASIGTAAEDRIVCLVVTSELTSASPDSATIDYGTGALTMNASTQGNFGAVYARVFWLPAPTGTTATFAVTFGANASSTQNHVSVYRVVGARPSVTTGGNGSTDMDATAPLTTGSITIATNGGFLAVAAGATSSTAAKTWANATEDLEVSGGGFCHTTATRTTSGTVTVTCTGGTNNEDGAMSWLIFTPGTLVAANAGSFSLSGSAATLKYGRKVAADAGSFALTGSAASVRKGYPLAASAGSFAVSGQAASLEYGRELAADPGSYALTGAGADFYLTTQATEENLWPNSEVMPFDAADSLNVTLTSNAVVAPDGTTTAELITESTDGGSATHTFGEFSLPLADQVTVSSGLWYTFSFYAKAVTGTRNLLLEFYSTTDTAVFSVALDTTTGAVDVSASDGIIGAVKVPYAIAAANGYWRVAVSLYFNPTRTGGWGIGGWGDGTWGTETTASVDPVVLDAIYGEIRSGTTPTYTGNGSSIAFWGFQVNRGGRPATYSKTPSSGNKTLSAGAGSFALSGQVASLELGREVAADAGSFAVAGEAASIEYGRKIAADAGSLAFNGVDASLELGREILALAGSFTFSGQDASPSRGYKVTADAGSFALNGVNASLERGREIAASAGVYAYSGIDAALEYGRKVTADPGSFAVNGVDAILERGYEVAAASGAFAFNGTDATLTKAVAGAKSIAADAGAFAYAGLAADLELGREITAEPGVFTFDGTESTLELTAVTPVVSATGGGSSAPPKDDWWRSPPGKKKRRKAPTTDTGAPIEVPLSIPAIAARKQTAEEAARVAAEALAAARQRLDEAIRNKVAGNAIAQLKTEAAQRERVAVAAQAALDTERAEQRRLAIMADDDFVLLLAA